MNKLNPHHESNWPELETVSVFDKEFEDFLDSLVNNNEVEMMMRDDWLTNKYQTEVYL